MTTLVYAQRDCSEGVHALSRELAGWLDGHWAALFSHPEDFAPPSSTPSGFSARIALDFAAAHLKPLRLKRNAASQDASWIDTVAGDGGVVVVGAGSYRQSVVDLAERSLCRLLKVLRGPFVLLIDSAGRCRSTIRYSREPEAVPRTIGDILAITHVLREGTPCAKGSGR